METLGHPEVKQLVRHTFLKIFLKHTQSYFSKQKDKCYFQPQNFNNSVSPFCPFECGNIVYSRAVKRKKKWNWLRKGCQYTRKQCNEESGHREHKAEGSRQPL